MWLANKVKNDLPQMVFMGYKLNNLNPQAHTPLCVYIDRVLGFS